MRAVQRSVCGAARRRSPTAVALRRRPQQLVAAPSGARGFAAAKPAKPAKGAESSQLQTAEEAFGEIDLARDLPTYGPAATAGYSALTFGFLGFGVSAMGYVAYELFGSSAPERVFDMALDDLVRVDGMEQLLGGSIKGFGDGRKRNRKIQSEENTIDGVRNVTVVFNVQGEEAKARVFAQVRDADGGGQEYVTFFLTLETGQRVTLVQNGEWLHERN